MSSKTIPLAVPGDLEREIRSAAKKTRLSIADVMRQSMEIGLPELLIRLTPGRLTNVEPLPKEVLAEIYSRPERDEKGIDRLIDAQPKGVRD